MPTPVGVNRVELTRRASSPNRIANSSSPVWAKVGRSKIALAGT
jgi:hypothetical protein